MDRLRSAKDDKGALGFRSKFGGPAPLSGFYFIGVSLDKSIMSIKMEKGQIKKIKNLDSPWTLLRARPYEPGVASVDTCTERGLEHGSCFGALGGTG